MTKTILIIDDDDVLRDSLAKGLRVADFNVLTAQSAEIAKEILFRISPDAIVLDRMMTGQNGISFLNDLRKSDDKTPVLMLTALGGPENAIDGLSAGADDYLAKPFQLKELILRLNNILKIYAILNSALPAGLLSANGEFYVNDKILSLSGAEKSLLKKLVSPVGNTVMAAPMVAKRLRIKLKDVLSNVDVLTIRGKGYKLVTKA